MNVPYDPELEMVKVPPARSFGVRRLDRGVVGQTLDVTGDGAGSLIASLVQNRGKKPFEIEVDRIGQVDVMVYLEAFAPDGGIDPREIRNGSPPHAR